MDPTKKKRVTKKVQPVILSSTGPIKTSAQLKEALQATVIPRYGVEVQPSNNDYVMPHRVAFLEWVDRTFKRNESETGKAKRDCSSGSDQEALDLFAHQKFIKDYLQAHSPYRGLLLYHGIGVGKSCSSIAAAEILMSSMKVVVLLPASLRDNYIGEMKKCGTAFYGVREHHWVFVDRSVVDEDAIRMARITKAFVDEYRGLWVPLAGSKPNWNELAEAEKEVIQSQVNLMISHSVEFLHYNGLNTKALTAMVKDGNPFDNKCVVVDEIHNLISMVSNNGKIGRAIYNLLMQAKNMKLILLSGTPIINYPHEIAFLLNLVTGPRKVYKAKAAKASSFDTQALTQILDNNVYVEWYEMDINNKTLQWSLLPEGFKKTGATRVRKVLDAAGHEMILSNLWNDLSQELRATRQTYTNQDALTLPQQETEFNEYFVNFTNNTVKNSIMFMRRILGTVSFYSTYSPELYPSVSITEVPLEMNDFQFNAYEKARAIERRMEKSSSQPTANIFRSSGQVYRFYSRAICNFVFPEAVERPFPTNMNNMSKEVDDMDDDLIKEHLEKVLPDKADMTRQYKVRLNAAIQSLVSGDYLSINEVHKYSPKFKYVYDRIESVRGCALIYSQFRQVEGLGLFGEFLKKCGYAEFKIRWDGKEWDLDISPEDIGKPTYMSFTGSNEETRVLLGIFNSTNIPPKIKERFGDTTSNKYGDIIKVLMITKSGAEGISLKNVRQVHVLEPYWNHIRIDQVIGRAVRTCSHMDLKETERKVDVFVYTMEVSAKQLKSSVTMRRQDKSMTSDQFIYDLAKRKAKIINEFLQCMQRASVDCALNAKKHGSMKCFAYPINASRNTITFQPSIMMDVQDHQYTNEVETLEWKGRVLETKKGRFLIRPGTNEAYDYDVYEHSGRLVLLGQMSEDLRTLKLHDA